MNGRSRGVQRTATLQMQVPQAMGPSAYRNSIECFDRNVCAINGEFTLLSAGTSFNPD